MTAANLTAGTVASAIDGSAITNLTGTASPNGTVLNALDISACTNLPNAGIVSLSAAKLTAATVASAIDISACTNLPATGLSGTGTLPALNGSALTSLTAANVGTIAEGAAITNDVIVSGGTTNRWVLYPFGGGYVVKSITPIP
jgi:hypothetical protein